ncbi:MAG: murein L,D-transpeptidase [Vicinamibacterales bacterium]
MHTSCRTPLCRASRSVLGLVAAFALIGCQETALPTQPPAVPAPSASPADPVPVAATGDAEIAATIDQVLGAAAHPGLTWGAIPDVAPALKALYEAEADRLLWFDGGRPIAVLAPALAAIAGAADHGLDPADYDATLLAEQWKALESGGGSGPELALFDLATSIAAGRMLKAVHVGRVDPATMLWGYDIAAKQFDLVAAFRQAREGRGLGDALEALQPPFPHYRRARRMAAIYRDLATRGEPPMVPALARTVRKVEPGASWDGVPQLAARLRVFGDLPAGAAVPESDPTRYDGPVVDAVKAFQRRHGLETDGVIGPGTIRALNVSLAERIRQIELSMERMRWLPVLSERPNVFVNVALFRLWATDPTTGDEPLRMNVVVGESLDHRTPIFVEQMEYVIFRPYWNPPRSIITKEIVPRARRDPGYIARQQMEIVASGADDAAALPVTPENLDKVLSGRLFVRQKPGTHNSLGLAKFIFPNAEDVYMHGTPAQSLFARARRDFSHGCIRLENPAQFASWVLRDQPEWTAERIQKAMQAERPTRVNLKEKLTVVLFYATVHVNSEDEAFFVEDIYGHDKALDAALAQGYPYPVKAEARPRT